MKKYTALAFCTGAALCLTAGCTKEEAPEELTITNHADTVSTPADMSHYMWIEEPYADFQEISYDEFNAFFDKGGSGILYLGYDGCPWCERAVVQLNAVAREYGITVYYMETDPYVPQEERMSMEQYNALVKNLGEVLTEGSDGEKELLVPLVVGVKNGKITGAHTALTDDFEIINDDDQMNEKQIETLRNIYRDIIRRTAD